MMSKGLRLTLWTLSSLAVLWTLLSLTLLAGMVGMMADSAMHGGMMNSGRMMGEACSWPACSTWRSSGSSCSDWMACSCI